MFGWRLLQDQSCFMENSGLPLKLVEKLFIAKKVTSLPVSCGLALMIVMVMVMVVVMMVVMVMVMLRNYLWTKRWAACKSAVGLPWRRDCPKVPAENKESVKRFSAAERKGMSVKSKMQKSLQWFYLLLRSANTFCLLSHHSYFNSIPVYTN